MRDRVVDDERGVRAADVEARRRWFLAALVLGLVVFVVSTVLAGNGVPAGWELDLFAAVNDLPDWLYVIVWPVMQYGVFVTIPIATVVAWWLKRRRLAVLLAVSGIGIYVMVVVVKGLVHRGRPGAFFGELNSRAAFASGSLGFPSGHAAVAATIATLTVMQLRRPWRELSVALVVVVAFGRMYVGAHLPLDVLGGAAMGVSVGSAAMLTSALVGRRRPAAPSRP